MKTFKELTGQTLDDYVKENYKHFLVRFYDSLHIKEEIILARDKEQAKAVIDNRYNGHGDFIQVKEV